MLGVISLSRLTSDRARQGTYSIAARDSRTGALGVAVQSHWFSVGPIVPWARVGVGAVATQANAEISYGPRGLELMASGLPAPEALRRLLIEDPIAATRQVAMVDAEGGVAAHTGDGCIPFAGDVAADGVSCQANIMANETVWPAMLEAYLAADAAPLGDRLLDALDAAEARGGDIRGRQSAAILVVPAEGNPWDTTVTLRVEDHPEPLGELRRLVALDQAYQLASVADELTGLGRHADAAEVFQRASALAPDNHELLFWGGLGAAHGGELELGVSLVRRAIELQPGWGELLPRLPADVAPSAATVLARLRARRG
jgi:uncharacterized Ntn-hydrolase superfamily protein